MRKMRFAAVGAMAAEPRRLIIDTDAKNEADDQFAIVHALLEGEQIVDVRKGGIREDGRHFDLPARRVWLSPTAALIYQFRELLSGRHTRVVDLEQPVFAWK